MTLCMVDDLRATVKLVLVHISHLGFHFLCVGGADISEVGVALVLMTRPRSSSFGEYFRFGY